MGMFDGFRLRSRIASPQHRGTAIAGPAHSAGTADDAFDEFGAPEGGYGRLDMLLDDRKTVASQQGKAPAEPAHAVDYALAAPRPAAS